MSTKIDNFENISSYSKTYILNICRPACSIVHDVRFVIFFNKCLENDNNVVKSVAFKCICKSRPMFWAGNNYIMLINVKMSLQSRD